MPRTGFDFQNGNRRSSGVEVYDSEGDGREIWHRVEPLMSGIPVTERSQSKSHNPRLGQGSFRLIVTDSYERRCAFTNFPVRHVLEAAHIRPYSSGGAHIPSNGILLRQDLHTLFDRGYRTATPPHQVEVSSRIKEEFNNGKGVRPAGTRDRPSRAAGLSTRRNERSDSAPAGSPASRRSSSRADFPRSFGR